MTIHARRAGAVLAGLLAVAALGGCKAGPAKGVGFVDERQMKHDPALPFHRAWTKPGVNRDTYAKLYVAPVNTSYMLKMTEWQKGERKDDVKRDAAKLGVYMESAIKKAFRDDPKHRFTVVESPPSGPDALVLEVAIVEVVPSKVVLNALGYAPFGIGLGLTAVRAVARDVSAAAFEARVRDASSGQVIATYADREAEQAAPVSVRGLTWYSHAETMINQWARQFVQVANRKPGETVKDVDPFTLKPW